MASKEPVLTPAAIARLAELLTPPAETVYPESDGEPMAETDTHRDQMADSLIYPLKEHFRDRPDVYVSGNLLLYYEEDNPKASVAPDVFVVFGIPNRLRRTYLLWQEGRAPDVIVELTSESTRQKDRNEKRLLYEELGVGEYYLFDPLREYLVPPLQGFRLADGYYTALKPASHAEGEWEIASERLGLILRTDGSALRLYDPKRNEYLRTHGEEAEARRQAEARAAEAEAELSRLRGLLSRQKPDHNGG
ncbi:MAG: Uma2 family endonuclease [Chloroflexi bacterium]|nr:Uma2 family endonuclease [Chloroflexota bacterium]